MHRISELLVKRLTAPLSPEEESELQAWRAESSDNSRLYDRLTDPSELKAALDLWRMVDSERACREMQSHVDRIMRRRTLRYVSIAAMVAAVVGAGAMLLRNFDMSVDESAVMARQSEPVTAIEEIKPGVTFATLSDASGHNVALNASDTAKVAATLITSVSSNDSVVEDLCLDVPRGSEFKIQLEDGSEVWLNSSSRLYYPKTFRGDERKVRLEGEAYISVATDSLRPFYVETDNQLIRVYGTAFNLRYYPEEKEVYTTLERGSVSLTRTDGKGGEFFLTPGHQAVFGLADSKMRVRPVDTEVVTSWRKGRFVFEHQTLLRIIQDLSRWYDFDYEFADESLKKEEFMGSIPRYSDFTTAISILEKCGGIRFTVNDGRVLISRPSD